MDHQEGSASGIEMQIQASARYPSWKLYSMVPEQLASGLVLIILILAILSVSLNSINYDKSEQQPESEKSHISQEKVSATDLTTLEAGTVGKKSPKGDQAPQEVKPPKKIKHAQKEKARKRKSTLQQDRQLQSGIIPEPGMPKEEISEAGKPTTATRTKGPGKGKTTSQNRHSSDMPNKEMSNVVIETAHSTSEAKPMATSPSRQLLGPPEKETRKGKRKMRASHADLAKEDIKMKSQPYPRVKIEEDPRESKRFAEWAVRYITGNRMFIFTDGGSCAQGSSAAFTYTCLSEGQIQQQGHWHDVSYGIIGDVQSREAEMIALTKALEAVEMEAKRQPLDAESPLRVIIFTDSRDNLHCCQAILTNGKAQLASGSLARDNVNQALKEMVDRMRSMNSTVKLELHWVKGHSSIHHNKRADSLATSALHAVKDYIRYTRRETARDSKGYDLIPFADMKRPEEIIAQQAYDMAQELQKEIRLATQQHIDTIVAFQAKLEAQTRAVELMKESLNRTVATKVSGLVDLQPENVAVTSQNSPRVIKNLDDKSTDVASVIQSQAPKQGTQGITTDRQRFPGESPEPKDKEEIEGLTDKNITPKRLRKRRHAALMFLRIGKSLARSR